MKKYNFSAGPAILPQEVYEKLSNSIIEFDNTGLSILEISHRSDIFNEIIYNIKKLTKEILNINNNYSILLLSGGATTQFYMIPYNFIDKNDTASYLDSGFWAYKAIEYANYFGNVDIVASSKKNEYKNIPKKYIISSKSKYLHLTSNNTIVGTQIKQYPISNIPLIVDMSSDIFSREIDISKFNLIYASAQKNIGPAGTTLVIIKNEMQNIIKKNIPPIMNYKAHILNNSIVNTPDVLAIYGSMLNLQWIQKSGGVKMLEEKNKIKYNMLYNEIDRNSMFTSIANKEDRSNINICFNTKNAFYEEIFNKLLENNGFYGIKGHRLKKCFRVSLYNAIKLEYVKSLIDLMQFFENKYSI